MSAPPPSKIERFVRWDYRVRPKVWSKKIRGVKRCEYKLDGFRVTVVRDEGKKVWAVGRKTTGEDLWPKMMECLDKKDITAIARMPEGTVLDGELYAPNEYASEVAAMLARGGIGARYQPFAVPFCANVDCRDVSFERRDRIITGLDFQAPMQLHAWPEDEEKLNGYARELQLEGFMLKQEHYRGWYKVKRWQSVDCIVVDTEPGQGKHEGRLGALHIAVFKGYELIRCGKVGIGNDAQWRDEEAEDVLGRVVEVKHEGVQAQGALRFPRFMRWRSDKPGWDCTFDQLTD